MLSYVLHKGWVSHDFPKDQRESETFGGFLNGLSGENTNTWGANGRVS